MDFDPSKSRLFVAMPFDPAFRKIYEQALVPASRDTGFQPFRVDEQIGHKDIVREIEDGIRNSLAVYADLTSKNPNVLYEVGYARALETPLVVATQSEDDVPFDLRQRRYIKYSMTEDGVSKLRSTLTNWLQAIREEASRSRTPRISCHGTKFDVPHRNEFWNSLLRNAEKRFFIVGGSNKSWLVKSGEQSAELAQSVLRIVRAGGDVRFFFDQRPASLTNHLRFIEEYLIPAARAQTDSRDLESRLESRFQLFTYKSSNYGAIITDDRLILLPTLNSAEFRNETLVLEIWGSGAPQFANYLGDIDRLARGSGARVRWQTGEMGREV